MALSFSEEEPKRYTLETEFVPHGIVEISSVIFGDALRIIGKDDKSWRYGFELAYIEDLDLFAFDHRQGKAVSELLEGLVQLGCADFLGELTI